MKGILRPSLATTASLLSIFLRWRGVLFLQILPKPCKPAVGSKSFGVYIESLGFSVSISLPPCSLTKHSLSVHYQLTMRSPPTESTISVGVKGPLLLPASKARSKQAAWLCGRKCAVHILPSGQHNKVVMIPSAECASGDEQCEALHAILFTSLLPQFQRMATKCTKREAPNPKPRPMQT